MKKISYILTVLIISIFINPCISIAASKALPNLEVTAKKLPTGKVVVMNTAADGIFSFDKLEAGNYELFINGEVTSIGIFPVNNGKISGKVLISIDDDAPVPVPVATIAPATTPAVVSTPASTNTTPVSASTEIFKFEEKNWEKNSGADHISKLEDLLKKENMLPTSFKKGDSKTLKSSIKKFQLKYGIRTTGNVGPSTAQKLNEILKNNQN